MFSSSGEGALGWGSFWPTALSAGANINRDLLYLESNPCQQVLAYDPDTGRTEAHRLDAVLVHLDQQIEHLALDRGSITTTPDHPFFTLDRGWVEAGSLRVGEPIATVSGASAAVVSFSLETHPSLMWDLTVDGAHTFFVGTAGVLVHNCLKVTFSDAEGLAGHGARHLPTGVAQADVEAAIETQIRTSTAAASGTGSFWGRVTVEGVMIEYRAYTLPDGRINVGTYYAP